MGCCLPTQTKAEVELQAKIDQVLKQKKALQDQLDEERQQRIQVQQQMEEHKRRANDFREQIAGTIEKPKPEPKSTGRCSWCTGHAAHEAQLVQQLKKLEEDLQVAKQASLKLQESMQKERLESGRVSVGRAQENPADGEAERKAFLKDVSYFKKQTPSKQREMKTKIEDLFEEVSSLQEELEAEREMREQAEDEALAHEAQAASLEVQARRFTRTNSGLDRQLNELVNSSESAKAKSLSSGVKAMFRLETPAKQREMKEQIRTFLADLDAQGDEVIKAHNSHDEILKARGSRQPSNRSNAFAFGTDLN